jgi:glycosyltransferase involved in cell wall biosynthesis
MSGTTSRKVLLATTAYPRHPDDTQGVFVHQQALGLRTQGIDLNVVAMHAPGSAHREHLDGIAVYRPRYLPDRLELFRSESGGIPEIWRRNKAARLTLLPFAARHTLAIAQEARRTHAQVIHSFWTLSGMATWAGYALHQRPYVVTVLGSDILQAAKNRVFAQLTRRALAGAQRVIAISRTLARQVESLGIAPARLSVIPLQVDTHFFSPGAADAAPRKPAALFAGSLITRKGVTHLLSAAALVIAQYPEFEVIIVGEGPLRAELQSQAARVGIAAHVHFTGNLSQQALRDWMRRVQFFVLPSTEEGLGVVLLEAMACGAVCLGSDIGGIPDILAPDQGVLFPPADHDALARAIKSLLAHPSEWAARSLRGRAHIVDRFDRSVVAAAVATVYDDVLAGANRIKT